MYEAIYDLCKVRNVGSVFKNETGVPTPRVQWILDLLDSKGMKYTLDEFSTVSVQHTVYNIVLTGDSDRWVTCHHDIVNPDSDNAQDNSCSIINAIILKQLVPSINIAILDGEEFGGIGSRHLSNQMNNGDYGVIDWILNLELTGLGGKDFLICNSNIEGKLSNRICSMFECDIMRVPFNDSVIFRANGFDSLVINPLPRKDDGTLDTGPLWLCHSIKDSVDKISIEDMKVFTEEVLVPIVS
jgi:hypothetical protein